MSYLNGWHHGARLRDEAYLALGPDDDEETTDSPWSGPDPQDPSDCGTCSDSGLVRADTDATDTAPRLVAGQRCPDCRVGTDAAGYYDNEVSF